MVDFGFARQFPAGLRGAEMIHPWIYPWFGLCALALGIPATVQRPVGTWIATSVGVAVVLSVACGLWLVLRRRSQSRRLSMVAVLSLLIGITIACAIVDAINPDSSFAKDSPALNSLSQEIVPASTKTFLTLSLIIVWALLWMLLAVLVSGQRSYRRERRALRAIRHRIESIAAEFSSKIELPTKDAEREVVAKLRSQAGYINTLINENVAVDKHALVSILSRIRDEVAGPALDRIGRLSFDETAIPPATRRRRAQLSGVPFRWNGRYFSGIIGALIIGIVALSASANVELTSPGFLIQIPMIVLAFFLSVSASLLLFLAAALTPFLGPNSGAPENYAFFVVILLLALLSFLHRVNEVRQVRLLEALSVINTELTLEMVRVRQRVSNLQKTVVSIVHGKVQSVVVAALVKLEAQKSVRATDAQRIVSALNSAADALVGATEIETPQSPLDFATAIAEVIALWDGSLGVNVSVTPEADALLAADRHATATTIEVISEATLNAAKHSDTKGVDAHVTAEGSRLRVTVTSPTRARTKVGGPSTHVGLNFLRQLTSDLRLEISDQASTLVAEIPTRVNVS